VGSRDLAARRRSSGVRRASRGGVLHWEAMEARAAGRSRLAAAVGERIEFHIDGDVHVVRKPGGAQC